MGIGTSNHTVGDARKYSRGAMNAPLIEPFSEWNVD